MIKKKYTVTKSSSIKKIKKKYIAKPVNHGNTSYPVKLVIQGIDSVKFNNLGFFFQNNFLFN